MNILLNHISGLCFYAAFFCYHSEDVLVGHLASSGIITIFIFLVKYYTTATAIEIIKV